MNPIHRHAQSLPDLAGLVGRTPPATDAASMAGGVGAERRPLVLHVVDTLRSAGVVVPGLVRHLPGAHYRHAVVCQREHADYEAGLRELGVEIVNLHQQDSGARPWLRLHRVLRALRPTLVHTHNRQGLPAQLAAALAGVRLRVHAEHGHDPARQGRTECKGGALLRLSRPLVQRFIADSHEVERWLVEAVGAEPARISRIPNGVDSVHFHPRLGPAAAVGPPGFMHDGVFVIGCIGPMDDTAGHAALAEAFLRLIASPHTAHQRLRLMLIGDGPARAVCQGLLSRAGAAARAWLPGERADTAQLLRAMDLFVQPAAQAGTAASILEAMASGLPVVAAAAGQHTELVHAGLTGILVPALSVEMLAAALSDYCRIPEMAARHGARARSQVIARHSLPAMARAYFSVYDALTGSGEP